MTLKRSKTSLLYIKVHFIIDKQQLKHILNSYSSNHHSTEYWSSQRLYSSHKQHTVLIRLQCKYSSLGRGKPQKCLDWVQEVTIDGENGARPVTQRHQTRVRFQSFPLVKSQGPSLKDIRKE